MFANDGLLVRVWEQGPSNEKLLPLEWHGILSLLTVDVGGVTSGQVDLGDIRKVAECGPEKESSKPHSSWPLLPSLSPGFDLDFQL